jgi:UDP-N-acetyl-D-glucosamine dehydrogenase
VVLESTTYPGTTSELLVPILEAGSGLSADEFFCGYSPERIDPGNPVWGLRNTPKVVSGVDADSLAAVDTFFSAIVDTTVPVGSAAEAELVKLLENTFRHVNIALVNELAMFARDLDVDIWRAIDAAATKPFGFMKFTPGPGIGGHCIPLDPHYLAWKMRTLNYKTRFIDLASDINSHMPDWVVEKVSWALNEDRKAVRGSRIMVLGVAYKRDIDDVRESPALDVIRLLEDRGAHVEFHDPFVSEFREDGHIRKGVDLSDDMLRWADAVVIITDHKAVDYQRVADQAMLVVDTRNMMASTVSGRARVVGLASGRPMAGVHA